MLSLSDVGPSIIESLPASVLRTTPGAAPPPGVQALSPHPQTLRPQTVAVGSVFLTIATLFFAIRAYVKIAIVNKLTLDDYVCTAGFVFSLLQFVGITISVTAGAGGRHLWDSTLAELFSHANVIASWLTTVFITPALGFAKLTFLVQYYQLFWPLPWVRKACWISGTAFMAFYTAVSITLFVLCTPWPNENWTQVLFSTHFSLVTKLSIPTGAVSAAVDIFLLVLPMRAVTTLQLPAKKKVGLALIFLTGALASVASIIGLAYRIEETIHATDSEWSVTNVWIWQQVELFSGIACSCMPSLSLLLRSGRRFSGLTHRPLFSYSRGSRRSRPLEETKNPHGGRPSTPTLPSRDHATCLHLGHIDTSTTLSGRTSGSTNTSGVNKDSARDHRIHVVYEVSVNCEKAQHGENNLGAADQCLR